MTKGKQVLGFDYTTGKHLLLTPAEWRAKFPPDKFQRTIVVSHETWYRAGGPCGLLAAEAYAIIPEGK